MLNTININLKTDIKTDRPTTLPIKLMSQDKNNNQFILRFTNGGEPVSLDDTYTVEILTKFQNSGASRLTSAIVRQDYATWEFDTTYITQDEMVYNYVYVRKAGSLVVSADANAFYFDVGLSEIDKNAGRVAEVYDENYQKYLDEFKDNVNFEEIAQAESDRQANEDVRQANEILREENYNQKVDTAIVEADVVSKVDNKVTELTPQISSLTAQLAQTVSGEPGKKPVALAGVIRNTGSGWFYIDDAGHNRINMSTVSVQNGSIRVEHTASAKKVGALIATPDETFGKEGMIIGASVGNTFSLIDLFLPLNVQVKGDGTFATKSYFTPSLVLVFSDNKSSFTLTHPQCDALDVPFIVNAMAAGTTGEYAVSYSDTQVTVERRQDMAGYIYYDVANAAWKYAGDNVDDFGFSFGGGILTVSHGAVVGNLYSCNVSERDGGHRPVVVSPATSQFQIKFKDSAGATVSVPDANCKFYFSRVGAKYKAPFKTTERVVLKRGHAKVDATHVANTSGNIWIHGLMQN